ncbi:MAG: 4-hydroxy-tetrahydrodipicolinate reductase, partial [Dehalococcoidia bacterium]
MSPIKVVVHGAMGRMGQVMLKAVCDDPDLEAVGAVDLDELGEEPSLPSAPQNIPYSTTLEPILVETAPSVLVDFTTAEATMPAVRIAVNCGVHLVIGTTGLSSQNIDEIDTLCREKGLGAVVAPNFALGAVLMMHLAKEAARFFDYAEIIEMHHEKKIDAPSGTAIATARAMVEKRGQSFSTVIT